MMMRAAKQQVFSKGSHKRPQHGMALLVVLVLTLLIAVAAYEFSFYMESQYRASRVHEEQTQARFAAISGLEVAAAMLELPPADRIEQGGLFNNRDVFANIAVEPLEEMIATNSSDTAVQLWRCSLISNSGVGVANASAVSPNANRTDGTSESFMRFGMVNESAKLHIPNLLQWDRDIPGHAQSALMNLPGATNAAVQAWLQRIQQNNRTSPTSSYSLREKILAAGSASSERMVGLDQLKELWFGSDLNRNYRSDGLESQLFAYRDVNGRGAAENAGDATTSIVRSNGERSNEFGALGGWSDYLSWHNGQRNRSYIGQPRIDLNQRDLQNLHRELLAVWPADWANYVIAYRQFGPIQVSADSALQPNSPGGWSPDFGQPAGHAIQNPLDLVDSYVSASLPKSTNENGSRGPSEQLLASPFQSEMTDGSGAVHDLLDEATTESSAWMNGRVDISAATLPVLLGIPGMTVSMAQSIVSQRANLATSPERLSTVAWLLDSGGITIEQLRSIEPYITGRSDVYSVQSVGFRDSASPFFRCTATIDASRTPARVLDFQTWHRWGSGFSTKELRGRDER